MLKTLTLLCHLIIQIAESDNGLRRWQLGRISEEQYIRIAAMSSYIPIAVPQLTNVLESQKLTGTSSLDAAARAVNQNSSRTTLSSRCPTLTRTIEIDRKDTVPCLVDHLRDSQKTRSLKQVKAAHGFVLKSEFFDKTLLMLLNHVVNAYSKCSDFSSACDVFDKMPQRNIFSWTMIIVGATENGYYQHGINCYVDMLNHGVMPDEFLLSAVMQACIGLDNVKLGEIVHSQIIIGGFSPHMILDTSLLNMYAKLGRIESSCKVFDTMTEHNEVSLNAMISGLTVNGFHREAYDRFLRMREEGIKPNTSTFVSVSRAVGQLGDLKLAKEVQRIVYEMDMQSNVQLGTALIDMFSKCADLDGARSVFDTYFSDCKLNQPWNAMISGYSQSGYSQEAVQLFLRMCQNDIKPDVYTYCSVFSSVADLKHLQFGKQLHGMVLKCGEGVKVLSVCNAICDAYAKCGALRDAKRIFDTMEERNMVSWTTLVTAYSQCCEWEESLRFFSKMREEGFEINQFTFSSVLVSCACLCLLEYGQQIHGLLYKFGCHNQNCVESALIDMYSKCGCITEAERAFEISEKRDVVSWTSMISGYSQHGMAKEALELFRRMELMGVQPNNVTFLCVLCACSHGGMVEEGLQYFQMMKEKCGLIPEMEHYACMVDVFGRAGRLDEAWDFIQKMNIEPDERVWLTLLGASRVHGNVEFAEIAAQKIHSLNAANSAAYVLLSNMYRETENVEKGLKLRSMMKEKGLMKDPGYSWLSINGKIHKFCSGDQSEDSMYEKLDELEKKLKPRAKNLIEHMPSF